MTGLTWQPIATEPNDGKFRLYGLYVKSNTANHDWFEVHYLSLDEDGQLIHPSGDHFDDWTFDDFEVWAEAPAMLADGEHGGKTNG